MVRQLLGGNGHLSFHYCVHALDRIMHYSVATRVPQIVCFEVLSLHLAGVHLLSCANPCQRLRLPFRPLRFR